MTNKPPIVNVSFQIIIPDNRYKILKRTWASPSPICVSFAINNSLFFTIFKMFDSISPYWLHFCWLRFHRTTRTFTINQNDKRIAIDYNDIIFFETSSNIHKIILHAKKRVIEFTGQLKDIEKQLDYRFYRCHTSYIINIDNIADVDFKELIIHMKNGETCPVSVRKKKGLKKLMA